jgi:hypothetical protein
VCAFAIAERGAVGRVCVAVCVSCCDWPLSLGIVVRKDQGEALLGSYVFSCLPPLCVVGLCVRVACVL